MATVTANLKKLVEVPNSKGCTNFGCMAIDGDNAWALKTDNGADKSVLYYYSNVNNTDTIPAPYAPVSGLLGHGNGMSCNGTYLHFACHNDVSPQHNYILRAKRGFKGDFSKAIKIAIKDENNNPISTWGVACYKSYHDIISVGCNISGYHRYAIGKITLNANETAGEIKIISYFYVKADGSYVGQDIHYDKTSKLFFIPLSKANKMNIIYVVDMDGAHTTLNGWPCYVPKDTIVIDKSKETSLKQFEVESLGVDGTRKIVIAVNRNETDGTSTKRDCFFRITNYNL